MKSLFRLLLVLTLGLVAHRAWADSNDLAAVTAADDERVAATLAGDRARLEAVISDELRYAHSSGHLDTKASLIEAEATHRTVHESYRYVDRQFKSIAPGIVLMTGRVVFKVHGLNGPGQVLDLNFLAVWRNEAGHWRFLAWQSCKNPEAAK
jgi:hypothetical protein